MLLCDPNPNEPLDPNIAKLYLNDKPKFENNVKESIKKYAF